ncbi:MAG: hypothetical protein A3G75_07015 [Verrucomicrobia bacterium RIFCSPLOWO2_12_FULL_64_8]|nr:MAG: hypothetical protein A3G75_07015 [Verrucomicrobia bacterium RIFCSPLOWO2_12_FULL_64_8]
MDRQALVTRHNPVIRRVDYNGPLTVGNGGFAFTADITGLQTFGDEYYHGGIPLETLARWCWHSEPNPNSYRLEDANQPFAHADGRVVAYPVDVSSPAGDWLRKNPHLQALGQISLVFLKEDGSAFTSADVQNPEQTLDLWAGLIRSRYTLDGVSVEVVTACHPEKDVIAVGIVSDLLGTGRLRVRFSFPRGHDLSIKNTPPLDWSRPDAHRTAIVAQNGDRVDLQRTIEETRYRVAVQWEEEGEFKEVRPHVFELTASPDEGQLGFVAAFAPEAPSAELPEVEETFDANVEFWRDFWRSGGAVDFTGSHDRRAAQLEERIVLSQYLTAVQSAGDVPPQESGLTCNTWYGKHHTEMIGWHTAHFALWGRDALLARNLAWYLARLPVAEQIARSRGLRGARWPKMVGPEGRESPGGNPLIAWNQPHPIYLCELLYRNRPDANLLLKFSDLVLQTAEGLASMVILDEKRGQYVLGPPLWISQEIYDPAKSQNPGFELAYWRWALQVAQSWRERLSMKRDERWDDIIARLAPLPVKDGKYVALESSPDTFANVASRHDHPSMLAALGLLPGVGVDRNVMEDTLSAVLKTWDWETKIWGWDYPMIAMTATRLGHPEIAVDVLLRDGPNNRYTPNGHCPQRSDLALTGPPKAGARRNEIAVYLPANGSFLAAVALMVAGWDGCTESYPGFPKDGKWAIRAEGLHPLP